MTNKFMANFHQIFLFLFLFFIQQSLTQNPPIVPLTNALTTIYCHNFNEIGIMTIRCGINEKIRMLDAFDVVVKNKSHLPFECLKNQEHYSFNNHDNNHSSSTDCKIPTSFTSACSGRESCTLHMQRKHLTTPKENCYNELVDYTIAFFECVSGNIEYLSDKRTCFVDIDVFIHDVCSSQAITSAWGTLKTPNFPNPYTSNDDCWCKLSTQVQRHLLLSVIVFQLIPYDQQCAGAGLYLQSSEKQRSIQCTYLQQGYNYLSDTNSLYMNFYSRTSTVRGGFWIIYEASHPNAEVHLHCGSREKIGVPSTIQSDSLPLIPSSYNHGWSRLLYDKLLNPTTTLVNEQMMRMRLLMTTPRSFLDRNFKISTSTIAAGAFTYPYGRLTTFELEYGPRGWFLKYLFGSNMTATKFLQTTTTQLPAVKWNSTWRYIRRFRQRIFTTTTTTIKTTTKMTTTTAISTTIPTTTTTISTTILTTTTTTAISTTILTTTTTAISTTIPTTTTSTSTTIVTSTIRTAEQTTIPIFSTATPTVILETMSAEQSLLVISEPWVPYSTPNIESSTTVKTATIVPRIKAMTNLPSLSLISKTTLQPPTPWYSPAGPFDWWYWQRYTTKFQKLSIETHTATTTQKSTTTTTTTTVVTTVSTTTEKSTSTIIKTTTSTTTSTTTKRPMILTSETTTTTILLRKNQTTIDWFKWPHHEFTSTVKGRAHYDEEYDDWNDYFTTTEIQSSTIIDPLLYIRPDKPRQKFQQMSYLPTKSNEQINNPSTTNLTSSTKSYINRIIEGVTITNPQNIIQPIIKKSLEENGWFSRTDMKIFGVSILFVILLFLINLILFTVRRHRRRIQGRHLLSASSLNARQSLSNNHIQNSRHGLPINNLISTTNNNNNDILPAVGEIVIWDEKDQGGYMIDNQGEWAKIAGHQWFRNNILKTCNKTSFTKSFRSRFQFIRQSKEKMNYRPPQTPKIPQHGFKSPLLIDTPSLSPVPEIDDYRLSQISSEKINSNFPNQIQTLIDQDQDQSDEYYKRIEIDENESIYSTMNRTDQEDYSLNNQNLRKNTNQQGSVIISVPTMLRQEDETTYDEDSIYNQNYPNQSLNQNLNSKMNNTIIIGYCQTDFQSLDPKLLLKSSEKSLLADHQQFYSYSQSLQLSPYDSGFFDDQTIDSSTTTSNVDLEKSIHERRHSQDEKY